LNILQIGRNVSKTRHGISLFWTKTTIRTTLASASLFRPMYSLSRLDEPPNVGMYDPLTAVAPTSKLPDELKSFLTLLDEPQGLPVCRGCQTAVLPKSIIDHLRKHPQLPAELRKTAKLLIATLPSLDFDGVPPKPDGSAPIEALRVVDAFQCKHCPYIRRDITDIRKHINKEHEISAADCYDQILAQSWFGGRRAVYWRVCIAPEETAGEVPSCVWQNPSILWGRFRV